MEWLRGARIASYGEDQEFERFSQTAEVPLASAAQRMAVEKEYFVSPSYLSQQDRADWQHVHPDMLRFASQLIETLRKRNVPFYAHSAYRTEAEQAALFRDKRTKSKYPRAAHCQGAAVDIVHSRYHWMLEKGEWDYIGKVGKDLAHRLGLKITWGGDWSFYDPAHWELYGWQTNITRPQTGLPIRKTAKLLLRENPNP